MKSLAPLLLVASLVASCATVNENARPFVGASEVLRVFWRQHVTEYPILQYEPQEFATAATDGRTVYIGSSSGTLRAYNTHGGELLWQTPLEGALSGQPCLVAAEALLFIGTDGGMFYSIDPKNGAVRWSYRVKEPLASRPVYQNGLVYFTSAANRIYALDAHRGSWKWQYERESPEGFTIRGYSSPLFFEGKIYVGFSDGYLASLNAATGDVLWARSLAHGETRFVDVDSTPLLVDGKLYVSSYAGGVYAVDPKEGAILWRFEVSGAGSVSYANGRLYFAAAKFGLYSLDMSGQLLWRQGLSAAGELSQPLLVGSYVLVSGAANVAGTYVADAQSGQLYQFFHPGHGVTAAPISDGEQIYLLSNNGFFYAFVINRNV